VTRSRLVPPRRSSATLRTLKPVTTRWGLSADRAEGRAQPRRSVEVLRLRVRYRGRWAGGIPLEQFSVATANRPTPLVRAHCMASSSRAVSNQPWPFSVDPVEEARLGCVAPHGDRPDLRSGAQRHHWLRRGRREPGGACDERLGRGRSLVAPQLAGPIPTPGFASPVSLPGTCVRAKLAARSASGCGRCGSLSIPSSTPTQPCARRAPR